MLPEFSNSHRWHPMSLDARQVGRPSEAAQLHLGFDWLHNKDLQVFDIQLI